MKWIAAGMVVFCLLSHADLLRSQSRAGKVFLLDDGANHQWCAFANESDWETAKQSAKADTVGALTYASGRLQKIDVTETDETGDWIVYDHYSIDDQGNLTKLERTINVLPGDRSVAETFAIAHGKATRLAMSSKELSTNKTQASPPRVWLPRSPIRNSTSGFPFSQLLSSPGLRTSAKMCVSYGGKK